MRSNTYFNVSLDNGFDTAYNMYKNKINCFEGNPIVYFKGCKLFNICIECAAATLRKHDCNICKKMI